MADNATHLVLLPGLDGTGRLFAPMLAELPPDVRVQVVAYPTDKAMDLGGHAQLVKESLPTGRIVLLAESFSGLVALQLLADGEARVDAVIFCAAFAEPPHPALLAVAARVPDMAGVMALVPDAMLRRYCLRANSTADDLALLREVVRSVAPRVLKNRLRLMAERHSFATERFDVPCVYLQAAEDHLVPSHAAEWFSEHFARCKVERVEGPHFLLQAAPKDYARLVRAVMNDI